MLNIYSMYFSISAFCTHHALEAKRSAHMHTAMRFCVLMAAVLTVFGCSSYNYPSQVKLNEAMITASGETLDGTSVTVPDDLAGEPALLIFGYVHKSQFDIDRWLIGLDMSKADVLVYELPTIKNPFAAWFSDRIDDAMREGIPREIWSDVITIYDDGDKVQRYTGNQAPKNARLILIDAQGKVRFFYDRGFSVKALNELNAALRSL